MLFLRIDYASGYDPPGSKFTRIDFFVTPALCAARLTSHFFQSRIILREASRGPGNEATVALPQTLSVRKLPPLI